MVLEKVFRVSNRQPRISMAARATRLRSRPRSTTLSSSLRHLDTSMHLLRDATILYFIRNGKQENCQMPFVDPGGDGGVFFSISISALEFKVEVQRGAGVRHPAWGLGSGSGSGPGKCSVLSAALSRVRWKNPTRKKAQQNPKPERVFSERSESEGAQIF